MKRILFLLFIIHIIGCANESEKSKQPPKNTTKKTVPTSTSNVLPVEQKKIMNPAVQQKFPIDEIMGKIDPPTHKDFIEMSTEHASKKKMYLRKDAYEAFKKMYIAAQKDGINLKVLSATRPFNHQKSIWEAKWTGKRLVSGKSLAKTIPKPIPRALKILQYSSMPGTSRHHWGTDIDINAFENEYFAKGKGKQEYDWLVTHASDYGFCQPYTPKGTERPNGYNEEKWHWSYMPISKTLTKQAKNELKDEMIKGFKGAETAPEIGIVEKYILGISKHCF